MEESESIFPRKVHELPWIKEDLIWVVSEKHLFLSVRVCHMDFGHRIKETFGHLGDEAFGDGWVFHGIWWL